MQLRRTCELWKPLKIKNYIKTNLEAVCIAGHSWKHQLIDHNLVHFDCTLADRNFVHIDCTLAEEFHLLFKIKFSAMNWASNCNPSMSDIRERAHS